MPSSNRNRANRRRRRRRTADDDRRNKRYYVVHASCATALAALKSVHAYAGRVLEVGDCGTMFVEESISCTRCQQIGLHDYICRSVPVNNNHDQMNNSMAPYTEKDSRAIFRQIAKVMKIMHDNHTAHRNISMKSFVVHRVSGLLTVTGFQHAKSTLEPTTSSEGGECWTMQNRGDQHALYAFRAPELGNGCHSRSNIASLYDRSIHDRSSVIEASSSHDSFMINNNDIDWLAADMWSLGSILYLLLTGIPPFRGNGTTLANNKNTGKVTFDIVVPSRPARRLVRSLLQADPTKRLTIHQALSHEWMSRTRLLDSVLDQRDLSLSQSLWNDWDSKRPCPMHTLE